MRDAERDFRLAARALEGDAEAAAALVEGAVPVVRGLARRLAGNEEEGDALAQATVVRGLERLGKYRGEATFATWLCGIAVHLQAELRRRAAREARAQAQIPAPPCPPDPAKVVSDTETTRLLWSFVSRLSPAQQEALTARVVAGSVAEGAVSLGLTTHVFRSRLHRARLALRDLLLTHCPELLKELGYGR